MTLVELRESDLSREAHSAQAEATLGQVTDVMTAQLERGISDPYMEAGVTVLTDRLSNDLPTRDFYRGILIERDLPPGFAVNLFFRGVQSLLRHSGELDPGHEYPFVDIKQWSSALDKMMTIDEERSKLREILLNKDTITTVYERYAGAQAMLNLFFPPDQRLHVADLGCGANYGLRGMSFGEPFADIKYQPGEADMIESLIRQPVNLAYGLGVDLADPEDPEVIRWRNDCRYPSELTADELEKTELFVARLRGVQNVEFLQRNVLKDPIPVPQRADGKEGFDACILSTMCYQMKPKDQLATRIRAEGLLNPSGLMIVQDFAEKVPINGDYPIGLDFVADWAPGTYRTFVLGPQTDGVPAEMLRWTSGRCREVSLGEDFHHIVSPGSRRTA